MDIKQLAELARVDIKGEEAEELQKEMEGILRYVEQIKEVTTSENAPEAGKLRNVMREDGEPHESGVYTADLMKEVPQEKDGYVQVKKVLNQ